MIERRAPATFINILYHRVTSGCDVRRARNAGERRAGWRWLLPFDSSLLPFLFFFFLFFSLKITNDAVLCRRKDLSRRPNKASLRSALSPKFTRIVEFSAGNYSRVRERNKEQPAREATTVVSSTINDTRRRTTGNRLDRAIPPLTIVASSAPRCFQMQIRADNETRDKNGARVTRTELAQLRGESTIAIPRFQLVDEPASIFTSRFYTPRSQVKFLAILSLFLRNERFLVFSKRNVFASKNCNFRMNISVE